MVYVLNQKGKPLMPTTRHGKVRRLLKEGKAKAVQVKPFTIQLTYETTSYTQKVTLGIDSGYLNIGFSATTKDKELLSGEVKLLPNMSQRLAEKAQYRRNRRQRLRYRKARWNNRKKEQGWIAPSIDHKLQSHLRFIEKIKAILPVSEVIIEVANFDIQKIKNPEIQGTEYQQGEQMGFRNLREYRGEKMSKGRRQIRKQRYFYQPGDLVKFESKIFTVKGTQNHGEYVALREVKKVAKTTSLTPYKFRKGFAC